MLLQIALEEGLVNPSLATLAGPLAGLQLLDDGCEPLLRAVLGLPPFLLQLLRSL